MNSNGFSLKASTKGIDFMKTLIALKGGPGVGKSATLNMLCDLLQAKYPKREIVLHEKVSERDVRLIVVIGGKKIAVESLGDPGYELEKRLQNLADSMNCVVIVCAIRTRLEQAER